MNKNLLLGAAGLLAIITAIVHATSGDAILRALELNEFEQVFVRATYQIGSMGWLAGGILLLGATGLDSQRARNWIVFVFATLYGFPAVGNFFLSAAKPSFGWIALSTVVLLALLGRVNKPLSQ